MVAQSKANWKNVSTALQWAFPMPTSKMMLDQLMFGASDKNFWKGECTSASFSNNLLEESSAFYCVLASVNLTRESQAQGIGFTQDCCGKALIGNWHASPLCLEQFWTLYSLLKMRLFHISQKFCAFFSFCHCSFVSSALAEDPQDQNF